MLGLEMRAYNVLMCGWLARPGMVCEWRVQKVWHDGATASVLAFKSCVFVYALCANRT